MNVTLDVIPTFALIFCHLWCQHGSCANFVTLAPQNAGFACRYHLPPIHCDGSGIKRIEL